MKQPFRFKWTYKDNPSVERVVEGDFGRAQDFDAGVMIVDDNSNKIMIVRSLLLRLEVQNIEVPETETT